MEFHQISVERTARYVTCGAEPARASELWFAFHGYGELAAQFLEPFEALAGAARHFVAPEGLSRFYVRSGRGPVGASWMTREARAHEIADQLGFLMNLHSRVVQEFRNPPRVHVFGFSQGAATAARFSAELARVGAMVEGLVLWAGDAPPELDLTGLATSAILARGLSDETMTQERFEAERARFEASGLAPTSFEFEGGHAVERAALGQLLESAGR